MISQLRREGIDLTASLTVTPTPLPTPAPTPDPNATPVPAPMPTAAPVPGPAPAPAPAPGFMERVGSFLSPPTVPAAEGAAPEQEWGSRIGAALAYALRLLAVAVPAYLLWWLPAAGVLRWMERGGNIFAARRRGQAKTLGPAAIALVIMDTRAATGTGGKKEKAKKPCPHCQGELSNPDLYQTPAFDVCPHCAKPVPPAFELEEYLKYQAEVLRLDAERADKGAISMNEFLKNSRMEKMIAALLADSVRRRVSDVHIEPTEAGLKIRRRVDGMMTDLVTLPKSMANSLVSALKVRADLDVSERRRPQDGSMSFGVDGHTIDMRVASSPAAYGEKMSIRLLDIRSIQVNPKRLGMTEAQREIFEKAIALPHGLLLVCGPTGSGKTTTLYVALQKIREQEKNIISIEDPIEFRLPGINQHQVNPAAGFTFASGLRSILRQDPDVIMIGEIRDKDTAEISIEAATTGHLVLSTTHTIDSATAMARLMEFGITPRRISDSLALIVAQRLIRMVCPDCKRMRRPTGDEIAELDLSNYDIDKLEIPVPRGCPTCNRTGYFGRTGLFEMLVATDRVRQALQSSNVATEEIRQIAIRAGMMTMRQQGLELLRRGLTTAEELTRVTR
jgi:type II secretory ATPase GspE/PulE/Tfp pilus assembly ATPase PilB-like protein